MARIASGVNTCCCRHVAYDVKQTLIGVIRPLAGGKCRTFRRVIERYRFHRYLCFHCVFCIRVFCILFCTKRVTISYDNCIHSSSTLSKSNWTKMGKFQYCLFEHFVLSCVNLRYLWTKTTQSAASSYLPLALALIHPLITGNMCAKIQ